MVDVSALIRSQNAYKIVAKDKQNKKLSHAYLILHPDGENLKSVLKNFAKIFLCKEDLPCGKCSTCRRIDDETYSDLLIYPKDKETINTTDVNDLIEESFVKPIEGEKKVFIINHAEAMNPASQNKILKTLEEPSKNVHIILGATTIHSLLPTVRSRVKKLEIPTFDQNTLLNVLSEDCPDLERLKESINFSDGTISGALDFYSNPDKILLLDQVDDLLINMKSSKQVLDFSVKITNPEQFIDALEITVKDLLLYKSGGVKEPKNARQKNIIDKAEGFSVGALVHACDKVLEAKKRLKFNGNENAVLEWLLFSILEGKYKWQKL